VSEAESFEINTERTEVIERTREEEVLDV